MEQFMFPVVFNVTMLPEYFQILLSKNHTPITAVNTRQMMHCVNFALLLLRKT